MCSRRGASATTPRSCRCSAWCRRCWWSHSCRSPPSRSPPHRTGRPSRTTGGRCTIRRGSTTPRFPATQARSPYPPQGSLRTAGRSPHSAARWPAVCPLPPPAPPHGSQSPHRSHTPDRYSGSCRLAASPRRYSANGAEYPRSTPMW